MMDVNRKASKFGDTKKKINPGVSLQPEKSVGKVLGGSSSSRLSREAPYLEDWWERCLSEVVPCLARLIDTSIYVYIILCIYIYIFIIDVYFLEFDVMQKGGFARMIDCGLKRK